MQHTPLGADVAEDVHCSSCPCRPSSYQVVLSKRHRVDQTGVLITLGLLGVVAVVVAVAIGWWWWLRKRVEEAEGWLQAEATIESGGLEGTAQSWARLPTFAFSYRIAGRYYSGRFVLFRYRTDPDSSLIERMIGRKLQVRYDPRRPEVWFIPDKEIEGCKVEQKIGPHFIAFYPKNEPTPLTLTPRPGLFRTLVAMRSSPVSGHEGWWIVSDRLPQVFRLIFR